MALQRAWYRPRLTWWLVLLLPLQALFVLLSNLRRWSYKIGLKRAYRAPVPVIVVGNISVGGTGKTPVTQALIAWLKAQGWQPAIISRGYGGQGPFPLLLDSTIDPAINARHSGDEPWLLAQRCQVPVAVGSNREQSIKLLLQQHPQINLIVSDDGLQHYALARDLELAVIDAERGLGNGWRLPMGPLREPQHRLQQVDLVVQNGTGERSWGWQFSLQAGRWHQVASQQPMPLPPPPYVAVAGIGHPQRFFATLKQLRIEPAACYPFADHYAYQASDFASMPADHTVLMTEKDAAKCRSFAPENWYYLPVQAHFEQDFWLQLQQLLAPLAAQQQVAISTEANG
ncbi:MULTISPECIES: tetraacyldisaccharide 4'-kinase [Pseudidiomarina]|uniref:Tetraacyldisaccharide 4'-kinase n=2 Tax=Pseudidiomarina TaxID=2800384 RepID=A0A368V3S1_9GAMM|nr:MULTISPECIES: tetraacyldisaccharide 4'-kinase [Pseudidiomarina]PWW14464.1 lipid-A-disaccharide kinase [Pseudidiomarina maritima]RBP92536.1 lipid-A-disaccharide kinase [Pseudidiomarina tainanensis]RCW34344.1 lipid-A-disaccharide kinase [Pseudidiomarina tainanensis]